MKWLRRVKFILDALQVIDFAYALALTTLTFIQLSRIQPILHQLQVAVNSTTSYATLLKYTNVASGALGLLIFYILTSFPLIFLALVIRVYVEPIVDKRIERLKALRHT